MDINEEIKGLDDIRKQSGRKPCENYNCEYHDSDCKYVEDCSECKYYACKNCTHAVIRLYSCDEEKRTEEE